MDEILTIKVTCRECAGPFQTNVPKASWDQYQDGIPKEIAFYHVPENATNLVVDKLCPTCFKDAPHE